MTSPAEQLGEARGVERLSRLECEAKLSAPPEFELPHDSTLLPGVVAGALEQQPLQTVYYDTPDLRLAARGIILRYRNNEEWTLKLPRERRNRRLLRSELRFAGANDALPAAAADLVQAVVGRESLEPVARLRTTRNRVPLHDLKGRSLGDMVDDQVSVVEDDRAIDAFHELAIELSADAPNPLLRRLNKALTTRGATARSPIPKLLRALGSRAEHLVLAHSGASAGQTAPDELASRIVQACFDALVVTDVEIRSASDPEHVHQARIAVRRLRAALRVFASLLDEEWTALIGAELDWLGTALGAARDADVLLARVHSRVQSLADEDRDVAEEIGRAHV